MNTSLTFLIIGSTSPLHPQPLGFPHPFRQHPPPRWVWRATSFRKSSDSTKAAQMRARHGSIKPCGKFRVWDPIYIHIYIVSSIIFHTNENRHGMKGEDMMFNEIKNASIYSIYIYTISIISQYTVSSLMRKKLLVEINNCKFERMYTCSKRENDYAMFGNMIAIACYACYTSNSKRFSWCNNLPTFDGQKEQERFAILHWGGPDAHTEPIEIKTPSEVEK